MPTSSPALHPHTSDQPAERSSDRYEIRMDLGPTTGSSTASPILASDDFIESAAWTVETEISANDVVEKEKLVREIMAMQDGLRALISRVNAVKEDCKKAEADNEMLQTYIDSVTKSLAAKERG